MLEYQGTWVSGTVRSPEVSVEGGEDPLGAGVRRSSLAGDPQLAPAHPAHMQETPLSLTFQSSQQPCTVLRMIIIPICFRFLRLLCQITTDWVVSDDGNSSSPVPKARTPNQGVVRWVHSGGSEGESLPGPSSSCGGGGMVGGWGWGGCSQSSQVLGVSDGCCLHSPAPSPLCVCLKSLPSVSCKNTHH